MLAVDAAYFSDRTKLQTTGRKTGLYRLEDALVREAPVLDLTDRINDVLFPKKIPAVKKFTSGRTLNNIKWIHSDVVGFPGSGKTELFKARAKFACSRYGKENVNIIYCDNVLIAIDLLNKRPVQYIIIDDSSKEASSTDMMRKDAQKASGLFYRLRHEWEERTGTRAGILVIDFGFQRWMTLRPDYRAGMIITFKTPLYEPKDEEWLKERLGDMMYDVLCDIGSEISVNDNDEAKGTSVALIPSLRYKGTGIGYYHTELVDFPDFPEKMLTISNYKFKDKTLDPNYEKNENEMEEQKKKEEQSEMQEKLRRAHAEFIPSTNSEIKNANYFAAYEFQGMSVEEIAVTNGVSEQTALKGIRSHTKRLLFYLEKGW